MDRTPLIHAVLAAAAQILVGLLLGNWWLGGLLACTRWTAREHTQAEYRWIAAYGYGFRDRMPWWGGFDPRAWSWPSVLDLLAPVVVCSLIYWIVRWH